MLHGLSLSVWICWCWYELALTQSRFLARTLAPSKMAYGTVSSKAPCSNANCWILSCSTLSTLHCGCGLLLSILIPTLYCPVMYLNFIKLVCWNQSNDLFCSSPLWETREARLCFEALPYPVVQHCHPCPVVQHCHPFSILCTVSISSPYPYHTWLSSILYQAGPSAAMCSLLAAASNAWCMETWHVGNELLDRKHHSTCCTNLVQPANYIIYCTVLHCLFRPQRDSHSLRSALPGKLQCNLLEEAN